MEEYIILLNKFKTIQFNKIKPIKLSDKLIQIFKLPEMKDFNPVDFSIIDKNDTQEILQLNNSILELLTNSKYICFNCSKTAQYKNIKTGTFACWVHSLE